MDEKTLIRKHVLANAIKFEGKANPGSIIGKIITEIPDAKTRLKELAKTINLVVVEVNKLGVEKQTSELMKLAPEMLAEKPKEEHKLPELKGAEMGKVVTRIAPEPSKYNHIGHALVFIIQSTYAKLYQGKCIFRLEETNPEKSTMEYYNAMREDLAWIGLKWDEEYAASDRMDIYYDFAQKLIKNKNAFVCSCDQETVKRSREEEKPCKCRKNSVELNTKEWDMMLGKKFKEGERTLRLVGDMSSKNGVMKDPVIFRISYTPHFLKKDKYCTWPMYDFESAIEDGLKITHIIRSKEFELRLELHDEIRRLLKLPNPIVREIGRYQIKGTTTQGREIRAGIERGEYIGWDDPSLVTIKALRRRGFVPEMFHELAMTVGLGKASGVIDNTVYESINRKLIDPVSNRFFFVADPVKIKIEGAPGRDVELDLHHENHKGGRKFSTADEFFVAKSDLEGMEDGDMVRLMDVLNLVKEKKGFKYHSQDHSEYKSKGKMIIHWLPESSDLVDVEVLMPDKRVAVGLAEKGVNSLKVGDIVQFERFGYCRLDKKEKGKLMFWYTHK